MRIALVFTLILAFGATGRAFGDLSAYDSFSDTAGQSLISAPASSGSGWSGGWTKNDPGTSTVAAGSLSYSNLATAGNEAVTAAAGTQTQDTRTLSSAIGTPGTTEWLSFLIRPDDPSHYGGIDLYGGTGSSYNLFIGRSDASPTNADWVLENAGGSGRFSSNVAATAGQTYLLVVSLAFSATGGNTDISLFVNPTIGGGTPTNPSAVKDDTNLGTGINTVAISTNSRYELDEIRIGTTFADVTPAVVPEPSSLVLMLIAAGSSAAAWARAEVKRRSRMR